MARQTDNSILEMALVGYSAKRDEVVQKMADIQRQLGASAPTAQVKRKHNISAAGRASIAEGQRRRWAASKESAESPASSKPKRRLSKAGRAAIVAAKTDAKTKPAVTKKSATKAAVKTTPATAARTTTKRTASKVHVQKAAPKKPISVKTKPSVKKGADDSATVIAQPTASVESAPTPEVVDV